MVRYAYTYGANRREKIVSLNSETPYVTYLNEDKVTEDGKTVNRATATFAKRNESAAADVMTSVSDLHGNVLRTAVNGVDQITAVYDVEDKLTSMTDKVIKYTAANTYDSLDRLTDYRYTKNSDSTQTLDNVTEKYEYNDDGNLSSKTVTVGNSANVYTYGYRDEFAKRLD